jgi:hypothetical protein
MHGIALFDAHAAPDAAMCFADAVMFVCFCCYILTVHDYGRCVDLSEVAYLLTKHLCVMNVSLKPSVHASVCIPVFLLFIGVLKKVGRCMCC